MKLIAPLSALLVGLGPSPAAAFCGFYVGKADAQLFNKASQVVLVRDGDRTVLSMANDYKGELKEFALVVPVPTVLKREQIHIGERALFERLDAYSAPRLVEYFDPDPCAPERDFMMMESAPGAAAAVRGSPLARRARSLGVTIEAKYTVGEYDILILGAKQSDGLETWLHENGYRVPKGASRALKPYILQKMKFFVAKVNLKEQAQTGFTGLRPLQFAYEDPRFMLPIRLGMINADGPQDLIVYALTKNGRVELTNYRTVKVPSDMDVPEYVKGEFGSFYKAMFQKAVEKEGGRAAFTEYAWNMAWCDPCSADPLSQEELRKLGVFWLGEQADFSGGPRFRRQMGGGASPVMLTRLHVRYDAEHFPEDLVFQQTSDQSNFQGRYVLRHPWKGEATCAQAKGYSEQVRRRQSEEARTLAGLTGWDLGEIQAKMGLGAVAPKKAWYEDVFR